MDINIVSLITSLLFYLQIFSIFVYPVSKVLQYIILEKRGIIPRHLEEKKF